MPTHSLRASARVDLVALKALGETWYLSPSCATGTVEVVHDYEHASEPASRAEREASGQSSGAPSSGGRARAQ